MIEEIATPSQLTREEAVPRALAGGDPPWLAALRQSAAAAYREAPWPASNRDEDWRRTPQIDRLDPESFALPGVPAESLPDYLLGALARPPGGRGASATLVTDQTGNLGAGTTEVPHARTLEGGLEAEPELWRGLMGVVAAPGLRKWVALNTARTPGGACIHVGRGESPEGYVRLVHGVGGGSISLPRTLIKLEEGATLTLLEDWVSPDGDSSVLAPVTEVELARGAHLTHLVRQLGGDRTVVQSTVRVLVGQEARHDLRWLMLGSAWQKSHFEVVMLGQASEARLVGLCLGEERQHVDVQTVQDHVAVGAVSDLLYRVAVTDRSRSVYAGLIRVEEGAQKTNAYVQNRNLLLSPLAKADSNPTLEILANDVRCTHGSTAGRIDDGQLFYCESRGIGEQQARRLIVEGFLADVIDSFPEGDLRESSRELVLEGLERVARSGAAVGSNPAA